MAKTRDSSPVDQNNIRDAFQALVNDHSATCVDLVCSWTSNGWIGIHAQCFYLVDDEIRLATTHQTYVTQRGPDLMKAQWSHLQALWHIVERRRSGLPDLIGF